MKYVLLVHGDAAPTPPPELEMRTEMEEYAALKADLEREGIWLGGQALHPASASTQVRVRDGDTLVVDGPLAETSEQIIGYYLLDCRDLDEALAAAARVPGARRGTVEVRPVWDYEADLDGQS